MCGLIVLIHADNFKEVDPMNQTFRMKNESYYRNIRLCKCRCPICGNLHDARTDYTGRAEYPPINCPSCKKLNLGSGLAAHCYEVHYLRNE